MSLHHAVSGELIDIRPLGPSLRDTASTALVRTEDLELMRMVLPAGKSVPEHHLAGGLTIQCIEGTVELQAQEKLLVLQSGRMVYLAGDVPYALRALEDASLLVTILRKPQDATT